MKKLKEEEMKSIEGGAFEIIEKIGPLELYVNIDRQGQGAATLLLGDIELFTIFW